MSHLIHVLEDDSSIREIVMLILEDAGYQVQVSGSVKEFFKCLETIKPALFLLDVMLPDGDGRDVCRIIKTTRVSIPVILMSAHAELKKLFRKRKQMISFLSRLISLNYYMPSKRNFPHT